MISQYRKISYDTYKIAQGYSPYRTGNLRHNAIFLKDFHLTKDGATWRINYNTRNARYIEPLNEGWTTKGGTKIRGRKFVESAFMNIGRYLSGFMGNKELSSMKRDIRSGDSYNITQAQKDARQLEFHKSVRMNREGKVSPLTDPKEWSVFRDIR